MQQGRSNLPHSPVKSGLAVLDMNRFMQEVADEIRAGLQEDKQKAKIGGLDPSRPVDSQITR